MIPELNKEYDYFDDGKVNLSRHDKVTIMELVCFNKIDKETKDYWQEKVEQCYWLYTKDTDYFVKGRLKESEQDVIFVRTLDNGWFSLGWWAGRLDIDGSLLALLEE
jgi:hypothetical protein